MAAMDYGNLRSWLDDHEKYASAIMPIDPAFSIAQQMLAVIAEARASLRPSADSTAHFVDNKAIIEQLGTLREQADKIAKTR
jgi:hypothetical protein